MTLNQLVKEAYANAREHGFWEASSNIAEKLMLIVTEVAEACEADRTDDKEGFAEELADIVIRVADLAGGLGIDLEHEIATKMEANKKRPKLHGKKY